MPDLIDLRNPRDRTSTSRSPENRGSENRASRNGRPENRRPDGGNPKSRNPESRGRGSRGVDSRKPRDRQYEVSGEHLDGKGRKKRKFRGIFSTILLIVAACVFVYSAAQIVILMLPYHQGAQINQEIRNLHISREPITVVADDEVEIDEYYEFYDYRFVVDFDRLIETNGDTVAWIRFLNPDEIDYPVVHSHDNAEYLVRTFDGNYTQLGSIFMDMNNSADFGDQNTIIYGHHMAVGGEMFSRLMEFEDREFFDENRHFFIYTPDGMRRVYKIFMAAVVREDSLIYQQQFADDQKFRDYFDLSRSYARHFMESEYLNAAAQIVTLSTCTNVLAVERFIIQGVLIEERIIN